MSSMNKTTMSNLALRHLGNSIAIANIDSDLTKEANACRAFIDQTIEAVLRSKRWPFASKTIALNLLEENPTEEWRYAYIYPADCLDFKRIVANFNANLVRTLGSEFIADISLQQREPYSLGQTAAGIQVIMTNKVDAVGEYTVKSQNLTYYPADFQLTLSFLLAFYIAPSVAGGDPFKLGDRALGAYERHLAMASQNNMNEEQPGPLPESEFISIR